MSTKIMRFRRWTAPATEETGMFPAVFAPLAIFFAFALRLLFPPGVFTGPESSPPGLLASAVSSSGAREKTLASAPPAAGLPDWVQIDYSALVDRRRLSHSGESTGTLLTALEGPPVPPPLLPRRAAHLTLPSGSPRRPALLVPFPPAPLLRSKRGSRPGPS